MDMDGDGVISMFEMEYFYEEQMQKMEALGIERLPFEDCLCQVWVGYIGFVMSKPLASLITFFKTSLI